MPKKLRITADTLSALRAFLSDANVDMGCRPRAVKRGEGFATLVVSDDDELDRLNARRTGGVIVEVLEDMPSPQSRLRALRPGNRFLGGSVPKGLGIKE